MTALALTSCGNADDNAPAAATGQPGVIRFTFSPDPVWDWLSDQGIREEMEKESGITIIDSSSWDEFALFAGGHADIVSLGTYELPELEAATGVDTVTFGKYNRAKDIMVVGADSEATTVADLPPGAKIGVFSTVGSTLIWSSIVKDLHGKDFRPDGGDYELIVADSQNLPQLLARGDLDAAIIDPQYGIAELSSGAVKPLYDGKSTADLYAEAFAPGHQGLMSNLFVTQRAWYDSHPEEVSFFLKLWERGLQEWVQHRDEIIAAYPQHFAATSPADEQFIKNYLDTNFDWFVDSVYLDQSWIDAESGVFGAMETTGQAKEGVGDNIDFAVVGH
ncbi:ABC transporter substrate-binding protein [Mycobacterium sp. SMC-4]|uniref:ABC transporter substrate-binding protein n=1 Tax=Mycobacterium sp. SMC-4 TaxID=2857059 RepID=UPI003D02AFE1